MNKIRRNLVSLLFFAFIMIPFNGFGMDYEDAGPSVGLQVAKVGLNLGLNLTWHNTRLIYNTALGTLVGAYVGTKFQEWYTKEKTEMPNYLAQGSKKMQLLPSLEEAVRNFEDVTIQKIRGFRPNYKGPKHILLWGPPGTGKSTSAEEMARMSNGFVLKIPAAELCPGKYIGSGKVNVDKVFGKIKQVAAQAAKQGKKLFVILDEIDSLSLGNIHAKNAGEYNKAVNTFNTHIDSDLPKNVILVGTTNKRELVADATISRFNEFEVGLPDFKERRTILRLHGGQGQMTFSDFEFLDEIANKAVGFSGRDLVTLIDNAAELAQKDFENQQQIIQNQLDNLINSPDDLLSDEAIELSSDLNNALSKVKKVINKEHLDEALYNLVPQRLSDFDKHLNHYQNILHGHKPVKEEIREKLSMQIRNMERNRHILEKVRHGAIFPDSVHWNIEEGKNISPNEEQEAMNAEIDAWNNSLYKNEPVETAKGKEKVTTYWNVADLNTRISKIILHPMQESSQNKPWYKRYLSTGLSKLSSIMKSKYAFTAYGIMGVGLFNHYFMKSNNAQPEMSYN